MSKRSRRWLLRVAMLLLIAGTIGGWAWQKDRALREARQAFQNEKWYVAIARAQAQLARYPEDDEARRLIAQSFGKSGRWPDAERAYAAIAVPMPEDLRQRGDCLVRMKQWFEAARAFEQVLMLEPTEPYALQQLAALRSKQGRDLEAISLAQRLTDQDGYEAVGYAMLATLHQGRNNLIGAVDCWKKVIELDPDGKTLPRSIPPEKVRMDLAGCLLKLGRWEESLPYVEFLEQRWPEDSEVLFLRGWAWLYQGEAEEAKVFWKQTLQRAPNSADALAKLGELELQLGSVDEAIGLLDRAVSLRPDDSDIHAALANAHRHLGNSELDREHMAKSEQLRRASEVREKARRFMQLDPASPRGKLALGLQLAREGKWHEAELWVREVLRENSSDSDAQQLLHDVLARRVPPEQISP